MDEYKLFTPVKIEDLDLDERFENDFSLLQDIKIDLFSAEDEELIADNLFL